MTQRFSTAMTAFLFGALSAACAADLGPSGPGGSGGAGGLDGTGGSGGNGQVCSQDAPITVSEALPPDLLLVMDKSGSMDETLAGGGVKINVMRQALKDIVTAQSAGINYGLMTYPTGESCNAGSVLAEVAAGGATQVLAALDTVTNPGGGTPTAVTMSAALQYYGSRTVNPSGRYVLLATDGQPTCLNGDGSPDAGLDVTNSVSAISALAAAGIKVYVLGFGGGVNTGTLQQMATAGGTGTPYEANSPATLQAALVAIAGEVGVQPCTFALAGATPDQSKLGVTFDGTAVARDGAQGWEYDAGGNSITFFGQACTQLQSGAIQKVSFDLGCGSPVIL